jgi:hypothetical protein
MSSSSSSTATASTGRHTTAAAHSTACWSGRRRSVETGIHGPSDLLLALQYLHGTLSDLDGAGGHGLLQTIRLREVDIGKPLSLVNLDLVDAAECLQSFLDERLGDSLRRVGMLQESLLAGGSRNWVGRHRPYIRMHHGSSRRSDGLHCSTLRLCRRCGVPCSSWLGRRRSRGCRTLGCGGCWRSLRLLENLRCRSRGFRWGLRLSLICGCLFVGLIRERSLESATLSTSWAFLLLGLCSPFCCRRGCWSGHFLKLLLRGWSVLGLHVRLGRGWDDFAFRSTATSRGADPKKIALQNRLCLRNVAALALRGGSGCGLVIWSRCSRVLGRGSLLVQNPDCILGCLGPVSLGYATVLVPSSKSVLLA